MLIEKEKKKKSGDTFFEKVYVIVRKVPKGRVTSYGAIASSIGSLGAARMVGWAMNNAHAKPDIPAHRVVNRQGILTGKHHFRGVNVMKELLESEGVEVHNDRIVNFEKLFWHPQHMV